MRAITVRPGAAGTAQLGELPEPAPGPGEVLVEALALGVCGTDREIVEGAYGWAPAGRPQLVLGHESLGRVLRAPDGSGLVAGQLVAGIVRRPDPVPCAACAVGQWDMCRNGRYREHGIKELDGFGAERWAVPADTLVALPERLGDHGVLVEPTSVLAKAWDHIDRIGRRAAWAPSRVLVTGAGPIGLLAALLARQRGYEVHVLDRVTAGPKPALVSALGASYHTGAVGDLCTDVEVDIVVECTGAGELVLDVVGATGPAGIVCLAGVSSGGRHIPVDAGALNRELVLENDVVFGSVNANRAHYEAAVEALGRTDANWLSGLVTRRVALADWPEALERRDDDVKVVIDFPRR